MITNNISWSLGSTPNKSLVRPRDASVGHKHEPSIPIHLRVALHNHQSRIAYTHRVRFGQSVASDTRNSTIAYRLSPIAYRLSPIAYRLSPIADWHIAHPHRPSLGLPRPKHTQQQKNTAAHHSSHSSLTLNYL